ncbi:MAG: type IV toxin-antitoxin system AbiEi family antitoxin domain-containing protein [Oryzihumus sp.]
MVRPAAVEHGASVIDLAARLASLPQPFTAADAASVGVTRHVLTRGVSHGELVRPSRGIYCTAPVWRASSPGARHLLLADAVLRTTPGAVASHHSAALAWGLPMPIDAPPWVAITLMGGHLTSRALSPARWHDGELPTHQVVRVRGGHQICRPDRAVIDCLRELTLPDAVAVGDAALGSGLTTAEDLRGMRRWQRRWPGITRADEGLPLLDGRRQTWLESWSFARLWQLGVSLPEPQVTVLDERGRFVGCVDGLWREGATVAETDGLGKYLGQFDGGPSGAKAARRVLAEKRREDRLRDLGLEVVRWTWTDVRRSPRQVVARIEAARARGDLARFRGRLVSRPAVTALGARYAANSA